MFASSGYYEHNLASESDVSRYKAQLAKLQAQQKAVDDTVEQFRMAVARMLAGQIPQYLMAVRKLQLTRPMPDARTVAEEEKLDAETFFRWAKYLPTQRKSSIHFSNHGSR